MSVYCATCQQWVHLLCGNVSACEERLRAAASPQISQPLTDNKITAILDERGSRYGSFLDNSRISQDLYDVVIRENEARIKRGQPPLEYHHKEALKMICAKICRILSGDPEYADNWDDIAGYAALGKHPR